MPLDDLARRYADELYDAELEQIIPDQERKRNEAILHGTVSLSGHAAADAKNRVETIGRLAEARATALLKAYERAGIPLDDLAQQEIADRLSSSALRRSATPSPVFQSLCSRFLADLNQKQ